MNNQNMYLKLM